MSKYIDADKLIAEIERLNSLVSYESKDRHDEGLHDAYKAVKNVIASLQQKQPEVDLEKEIEKWFDMIGDSWENGKWSTNDIRSTAHHFYILGLNARKEK